MFLWPMGFGQAEWVVHSRSAAARFASAWACLDKPVAHSSGPRCATASSSTQSSSSHDMPWRPGTLRVGPAA